VHPSVMVGFVQKLLEIFLSICGLFTHLFMLSNVLARSSLLLFQLFLRMVLGVLLALCRNDHLLYTTKWCGVSIFMCLGGHVIFKVYFTTFFC
jgi:putative Mn2+ efflux pump MntP